MAEVNIYSVSKVSRHAAICEEINKLYERKNHDYGVCWLCLQIGVDFAELCFENMVKLNERYPDGFDSERSVHRKEYENG